MQEYFVTANSVFKTTGSIKFKNSELKFGISQDTIKEHANPAQVFLGAISACILKNLERFSVLMKFEYTTAEIKVVGTRLEKPARMENLTYSLIIHNSNPTINLLLLKKNIENYGTIFNTVKKACSIDGKITLANSNKHV